MGDTANNHDIVDIELGELSVDQRALLEMTLRADVIAYEFVDAVLRVPASRAARARMLLADVRDAEVAPGPPIARFHPFAPLYPVLNGGLAVAGRWRRVVGIVIDALVLVAPSALVRSLDAEWLVDVVVFAYVVGMTAWHGQTIGKIAAGTRVVDDRSGAETSLRQSVLRWLPAGAVGLISWLARSDRDAVAFIVSAVATAAWIVIYAPILFDPLRRGLHDRLAGTVVLHAVERPRRPSAPAV